MKFAVLASHEGTTLQAVMDSCTAGTLQGEVCLVVSNNSASGAINRAKKAGIAIAHISGTTHPEPDEADTALLAALRETQADFVLLLGYMKKLGNKTVAQYQGCIINTHPALLPKFGGRGFFGRKVHEAVIEAKETVSGATIHLVDADYDTGPLLSQVRVPVHRHDTAESLETRVKAAEQKLLVQTLIELASSKEVSNF